MKAVLMIAAALGAGACADREAAVEAQAEASTPPVAEPARESRDPVGVVVSRKSEVVPAPFAGRLLKLWVQQGQLVKRGDKIATFDARDLDDQIRGAQAEKKAAEAEVGVAGTQAEAAHERCNAQHRLAQVGATSPMAEKQACAEWQAAVAQTGKAAAGVNVVKAKIETLQRQRGNAELVAGLDGIVMNLTVNEGEVIANGTPIVRIFNPDNLYVRFALPSEQRGSIARGGRVELRLPTSPRPLVAMVDRFTTEKPPINFTIVEASLDETSRLDPEVVQVGATGHVRLAR